MDGTLSELANETVTVANVQANSVGVPSKAISNVVDRNACIEKSNTGSDT